MGGIYNTVNFHLYHYAGIGQLLEKMIMFLLLIVCHESQMQNLQNQKHLSKVEIQGIENDGRMQMETYMNGILNMVMLRNMIKEENRKAL